MGDYTQPFSKPTIRLPGGCEHSLRKEHLDHCRGRCPLLGCVAENVAQSIQTGAWQDQVSSSTYQVRRTQISTACDVRYRTGKHCGLCSGNVENILGVFRGFQSFTTDFDVVRNTILVQTPIRLSACIQMCYRLPNFSGWALGWRSLR